MLIIDLKFEFIEEMLTEPEKLRKTLSLNIKKQRKRLGLSQEKLAEVSELSSQTINDIEGCRMWVSDKTISKLAKVLQVEAYQLLMPVNPAGIQAQENISRDELLINIEDKIISTIRQQFKEAIETLH